MSDAEVGKTKYDYLPQRREGAKRQIINRTTLGNL